MLASALALALVVLATPGARAAAAAAPAAYGMLRWEGTDRCLTAPDEIHPDTTPYISTCTGAETQLWSTPLKSGKGKFGLSLKGPLATDDMHWCLDGGLFENRGSPMLFSCDDEDALTHNRFWDPKTNGNRLEIVEGKSGRSRFCLDVTDGKDEDGTPVQVWQCTRNNRNQRWVFET